MNSIYFDKNIMNVFDALQLNLLFLFLIFSNKRMNKSDFVQNASVKLIRSKFKMQNKRNEIRFGKFFHQIQMYFENVHIWSLIIQREFFCRIISLLRWYCEHALKFFQSPLKHIWISRRTHLHTHNTFKLNKYFSINVKIYLSVRSFSVIHFTAPHQSFNIKWIDWIPNPDFS